VLFAERLQARQKHHTSLEKRRFMKNRRINAFLRRILFNAFFALNRWLFRKRPFFCTFAAFYARLQTLGKQPLICAPRYGSPETEAK